MNRQALSLTAPRFRRVAATSLLALGTLIYAGCTEGVDVSDIARDKVAVPIRAYYAGPAAALNGVSAINRIRITVKVEPSGPTFGPFVFDVADAPEWTLPVELPLTGAANVTVLAELMTGDVTEFSGRIGPIRVTPGVAPTPAPPLPVFPGPPSNLDITSLTVTGAAPVIEGGSIQLTANVVGTTTARVTWASLDPTLATVSPTGMVTTLLPGTARIIATAGPKTDTVRISINRRMSRIEIAPASRALNSLGEETTFTARVLDPRNAEFTGLTFEWSVADPTVAEHMGGGRFKALKVGRTAVSVRVAGTTALVANGDITVAQRVARVTVTPGSASFDAIGATAGFSAAAADAGGTPIPGVTFTWATSNSAAATVDNTGTVTARGNGNANITATADGQSGTAAVSVNQRAATITVSPTGYTFTAIGETRRFAASAADSRGNAMPSVAVTWRTGNPSIATVGADGTVTANSRGSTTVFAEAGSISGSASIGVTPTVGRIVITPATASLPGPGSTVALTASARDANGYPVSGAPIEWYSQTPAIVSVNSSGLVTAVSSGDGVIAAKSGSFVATASIRVGSTSSPTGPIKVGAVGCSCGNNAADAIFSSGDMAGTIERISVTTFNGMSVAELRARYDVLIITWATSASLNADWNTRLKPFLEAGGGIYWEDPNNMSDITAIVGSVGGSGSTIRRNGTNVPGLTDGVLSDGADTYMFANNHIGFGGWASWLSPFLIAGSSASPTTVGLYGEFGSGRMVLTGPDQDYHGMRGSTYSYEANQYRLLLNTLRWVSRRVPAGATGVRPAISLPTTRPAADQRTAVEEAARKQTEHLERIRAQQSRRGNQGSN